MKYIRKPCPDCGGIRVVGYHVCPTCNGLGQIVAAMTNGERIRAMNDEELAVVMYQPFCDKRTDTECRAYRDCNKCALEWLQQPEEEDDHVV